MQIVHVIPPANTGGHRHEERFADEMSEAEILAVIQLRAAKYGLLKVGEKRQAYLDHPETIVAIGTVEGKKFVETKRLAGPPA